MKKRSLFKAASALAVAAIMMVGVSTTAFAATYDVWDDETGSRIAFEPSDRPTVIVNVDKTILDVPLGELYVDDGQTVEKINNNRSYSSDCLYYNHNSRVDLKAYEVIALNDDDKIWLDSSKSTANINNIDTYGDEGWAYFGYTAYVQNSRGEWYNEGGSPDLMFKYDDKSVVGSIGHDLINKPHIIEVIVKGKDGSYAGEYFTYYQGFQNNETTSATSSWASNAKGWWIQNSDGSYLTNAWYQDSDGKWYYMGADGYMLTNTTTPDGYYVNEAGVWIQ